MGIGRNLAYRKELFYREKGFSAHLNLQRGDDDLFINHVATAENTRVETDADAIVRMQPVFRAKDWREEKIGYASTARFYHGAQRWLAGLETTTRLAVPCRMDSRARSRYTAFSLAGGGHRVPYLYIPVYPASHHHQQDRKRFERPTQILLVTARIRRASTFAVSPLETLLPV